MNTNKEFSAFISYSRKDKDVALWLQKKLEKYPYPAKKIAPEHRPIHPRLFRPVFLDLTDLEASVRDFTDDIQKALETSKYLILLCSQNSVKSAFVDREVRHFLKTHNNDYSKIVTLFIDKVEGSIPSVIIDSPIMARNFPIYNTAMKSDSAPNLSCFYQVAAFMLGVDFSYLYDRYEKHARRKRLWRRIYFGLIFLFMLAALLSAVYAIKQKELTIVQQNEMIEFEKRVYPRSIVIGYVDNFLSPVIQSLKKSGSDFRIKVLLPTHSKEIESHQQRHDNVKGRFTDALQADSLTTVTLNTNMKRGARVIKIACSDNRFDNIYLDFATTTTSFLEIAQYKLTHKAYKNEDVDDMIAEYAHTFIEETKNKLGADSVYVNFYTSGKELVESLKQYGK